MTPYAPETVSPRYLTSDSLPGLCPAEIRRTCPRSDIMQTATVRYASNNHTRSVVGIHTKYIRYSQRHFRFLPRHTLLARYMRSSCVLSVTIRCSTEMAKRRMTQTTPHDSTWTLVFLTPKTSAKFNQVTPNGGAKCKWGKLKSANFNK